MNIEFTHTVQTKNIHIEINRGLQIRKSSKIMFKPSRNVQSRNDKLVMQTKAKFYHVVMKYKSISNT